MARKLAAVVVAVTTVALTGAGIAAAGPNPVPKATGSVELASPMQYASFNAFDFGATGDRGEISYTNFEYAVPGSGVWVPASFSMGFAVDPSTTIAATYAMTVTSFTPVSPTAVKFTGTGDCGCGWISTFTGTMSGSTFTLAMTEINAGNTSETYALSASGTIASDGSVAGTWSDNYGGVVRPGTFAIADVGYEVFHYAARVTDVLVNSTGAYFSFAIPSGVPLAGVAVYVHVTDGGSPGAGNDTWGHGTSPGVFGAYPIVAGNLTVFSS